MAKGTIFRFIKEGQKKVFYVLPTGQGWELTETGMSREVLFQREQPVLEREGWKGKIL